MLGTIRLLSGTAGSGLSSLPDLQTPAASPPGKPGRRSLTWSPELPNGLVRMKSSTSSSTVNSDR